MSNAPDTVFSIRELCDQIALYLALCGSADDLKSAALVCHTLCGSAQSQIFRHVILDPYLLPGHHRMNQVAALLAATSRFHRLSRVLTASPHLRQSIRAVSLLGELQILQFVSSRQLTHLQEIRFNFHGTRWAEVDVLRCARDLIALPSIRKVEIRGMYGSGGTLDGLTSLFETCTTQLQSLTFRSCTLLSGHITARAPRPKEGRAQIKSLTIERADEIEGWLTSPSAPFALTRLADVEISIQNSSPLVAALASSRLSIIRLGYFSGKLPSHRSYGARGCALIIRFI